MRAVRRALVVRPEPGCAATLRAIAALEGWRGIGVPLTERQETGAAPPEGRFDAVLLTSMAAALPARSFAHLPVHAIGEATARAVREAGFASVTVGARGEAAQDGAAFGRMLASIGLGRPLYPCAEERRPELETVLRDAGVAVEPWPVYRTVIVERGGERLRKALGEDIVDAVLLHAPSGTRAFASVVREAGLADRFASAAMLCLSERVAEALPDGLGGARIVPPAPEDRLLVAQLANLEGR